MSKIFDIDFSGIKEISFEKYRSTLTTITNTSSINQSEMDYGEVEDFDYEKYLFNGKTDEEIEEYYKKVIENGFSYQKALEDTIQELEKEKERLKDSYSKALAISQEEYEIYKYELDLLDDGMNPPVNYEEYIERRYGTDSYTHLEEKMGMKKGEYQNRLQEIENDISILKVSSYMLKQQLKETPYLALAETERFQNYKTHTNDISYDRLKKIITEKIEMYRRNHYTEIDDVAVTVEAVLDSSRFYDMSEEDRMMCFYLLENRGIESVYDFVTSIEDKLNRNAGRREAEEFIESISKDGKIETTLLNEWITVKGGIKDGLDDFFDGIFNIFSADGVISRNQYAEIYTMLALEDAGLLNFTYRKTVDFGRALPTIAVTGGGKLLFGPLVGTIAGNSARGLSTLGNTKNLALINGTSEADAALYGGIIGISDATLGYFLKKVPFEFANLGKVINSSLEFITKLKTRGLLISGEKGLANEWVDEGLISSIANSEVDLIEIPSEKRNSFLLGIVKTGIYQNESFITFCFNQKNYMVQISSIFEYMNTHNVSFEEALESANAIRNA